MKNKEKFAKEILELACEGYGLAVSKETGKPARCADIKCSRCAFATGKISSCVGNRKEWAEAEYIEKPVISKKDKAFLEYLREEHKYIARDRNNSLYICDKEPYKGKNSGTWTGEFRVNWFNLNCCVSVDFPMVKWSDDKPWLIEDLKKLEVVEEYEQRI